MRRRFVAFGLAALLYTALTAAFSWPLVLAPASTVPNDLGDPLLNTYLIGWNARTLPLTARWWNLPQFYPTKGITAFSEHLLGLSIITTPIVKLTGNALLAYNAAFLLSFVLCGLSAQLLCFVITRRHDVSLLGGLAFAFAPYRMSQLAHVQVLSAYWMPLALAGLHLYLMHRRRRWLVLFAAAWLMQALTCGYYLFYLSALVGLWLMWFAVGGERWTNIARILAVWAVAVAAIAPVALGYLKYQRVYGLRRWPDEIESFSADIASVLKAPDSLRLWGWLNVIERPESALFPGLTVVVLTAAGVATAWFGARTRTHGLGAVRWVLAGAAVFGLVAATPAMFGPWRFDPGGVILVSVSTAKKPLSIAALLLMVALALHPSVHSAWRRRSPLAFYVLATGAMWLFSLGPSPTLLNQPAIYRAPYSWLMLLPGVDGIRVPARFWVLGTLCLAVAAALGIAQITRRWRASRLWLPALSCVLIVAEAWPRGVLLLPRPASRPVHVPAVARLELPMNPAHDAIVIYRAAEHQRPVLNGYSGYFAPHYWALQYMLNQRDPAVLGKLSSIGTIETVVDHGLDVGRRWRSFLDASPRSQLIYSNEQYSVFRIRRQAAGAPALPPVRGRPLPIAGFRASLYQDLVDRMTDGDRNTRWHTGGPQAPTNELQVDLGTTQTVTGVVMEVAGYVADFPRVLVIDTSVDAVEWQPAWSGGAAPLALSAALEQPLTMPLPFPFDPRPARYLRLRQTGADSIYYWSIAELRVHGH